jgi:hypothetical protein
MSGTNYNYIVLKIHSTLFIIKRCKVTEKLRELYLLPVFASEISRRRRGGRKKTP